MTSKLFLEKLGKLYHSGNNGFEGLVRDLLESLTGRKWFLAKSGSQGGSDMISEEIRGNRIVAECKRFRETKLKESELREKLADTLGKYVNNPPDAWILVTTSRLDAQTNESLKQYCHIQGIEFSTIDARGDNASDLAILCAHNPNLTTDFFKVNLNLSESEATNIQNELVNLSAQTNYSQQLNELKAKFAHESIGFNNWHIRQNEWLLERFASEKESRAAFGQPLNIRETGIDVIDRYEAYGKLNTWLTSWGEHHAPFVMLGEEGDGKTWTIATWLAQNMNKFPPIIFITSKLVSSNEPITLLVNIIKKQLSEPRNGYWEKRFKNWLGRAKTSEPLLVLVLDGVNENIKFDWRGLLESLDVEPWLARLALILTCRTEYWKRHFEYYLTEHVWTLPSFNDKELSQALATKALNRTDIPQSVMNLISKPRYFDLMVQLKDKIADSGDVTVERLIYEDWKDRTRRKKQVENLNNEDFLSLISDISEKFKDKTSLKRADIEIYFKNSTDLFEEFVSSKILVRKTGIKERYVVDKKYLIVGLGRLLADEIWNIANHGIPVIEETIAHWLEPQSDMDIKVAICGAAVFQALMSDDFPETARTALFIYWINGQNLEEETWDRVPTYLSIRPETYLNVAENLWSLSSYNQIAQDMMMEGFLRYGKWPKIQQALIPRFENWMGFIYLYGYAYRGFGKTEEKRQEERQKIAERIGKNNIDVGPLEVTDYVLNVITDEGLLQLARVALAVISHQPRKPYIKAITTGILARTIMGYVNFEAEIAWILLTAPDNIWPLVEKKAQQFLEVNMTVYKQAAYKLLTYSGHSKAYQLREQLPENLVSKNWVWEQCRDNPCELYFCHWKKDNYQTCLSKTNDAFLIAKGLKQIALDPKLPIPDNLSQKLEPIREGIQHEKLSTYMGQTDEDILLKEIEVTVCAVAPNILADILKRLARSLPQRANQTLHKAAWRISENRLIMTEAEKEAICRAWLSVFGQDGNHDDSLAENVLFFCTIQDRDASEQIELLLLRGDKTSYFNDSPPIFKPLSSKKAIEYLQKTEEITDTAFLTNVLWFISANPKSVPNSAKQYILNLLDSDKSHIRASVLQIILGMENKTLGQAVIEKGWQWNKKSSDEENHWGSLILCEYGTDMPYSDLLLRVFPTLAGYMLKKRGCDKEEILQYADYLMEIWKHITGQKIAISEEISKIELIYDVQSNEVSPDFRTISDEPHGITFYSMDSIWGGVLRHSEGNWHNFQERERQPREIIERLNHMLRTQRYADNFWFGYIFWPQGLREVVVAHEDYVKIWLEAVFSGTNQAYRILVACQSFYQALCGVLLNVKPEEGIKLYDLLQSSKLTRFIDTKTTIESLTYKLFSAHPSSKIVTERWLSYLDNCSNDQELKIAAFIIQDTKQEKWLFNIIKNWSKSEGMFDQARAFRLFGFLDLEEESKNGVNHWINTEQDSWLKHVAKRSLDSFNKNLWAKWWFKDFLTNEDDIKAWGSFRVFLKCVDHRFWLWGESMISSDIEIKPGRKLFYQENFGFIKKSIEENDKELKKIFLCTKVIKDQVWPWMKKYVS